MPIRRRVLRDHTVERDESPLFELERPELRPLTMQRVRNDDARHPINVASTFSGGGGTTTGFRLAGYHVIYANEFVESARATYSANYPSTYIDGRDIRVVIGADLIGAAKQLGYQTVHVLEGSPPCSAFSMAGKREAGWGEVKNYSDTSQRVDDLFFEWTRLVGEVQPIACVAENVPGLAAGNALSYLNRVLDELRSHGYRVDFRILNAADYGVPQARERLFIQGIRKDLDLLPAWPRRTATAYHTVEQVLDWVRSNGGNDPAEFEFSRMDERKEDGEYRFAIGREWERTKEGESSERYFHMTRAHRDRPSPTVTAMTATPGSASVCHPYEQRKFTVRELRLISSFPLDYEFAGTFQKQIERIGRAVPPLLARAVAESIRNLILPYINDPKGEDLW